MRDYDEITSFLGEWGPFQKTIFALLSLSSIPNGYGAMCMVFLSDTPRHHCSLPYLNTTGYNQSQALPMEEVNGQLDYSRCTRYKRLNVTELMFGNETERCVDGWDYSTERYISTMTTEWNLVCGDAWKVPFSLSVFFMGVFTGSILCGQVSDRFGRKFIFFLSLAVQTIFTIIQVVSVSWEMFAILYFIVGVGQISNYITAFILGNEVLGESYRLAFSTMGMCVFYAVGYTVLPLFAYFIRSWRILLLVLALPGFLYMPLWWFIPESPRWLLAEGRLKEAEDIVRAAAEKNGVRPPAVIFREEDSAKLLEKQTDHPKTSYTYLDLVRTSKIRNITILNVILWFSVTISYMGLSLSTPNMNGDPYLNCLLSAVMELVAYTGAWLMLKVVSRRHIISSTLLLAGAVLLLTQMVPEKWSSVIVGLAMVGKLGVTGAFSVMYISAMELYPTVVRGMGVGVCSMTSKMGSVSAPFLAFMGAYYKALPYIVMGLLSLAIGLLSLLLPETRGTALPEDLSQVQSLNWWSHREHLAEPAGVECGFLIYDLCSCLL
ncbi:solute carrier family 22 member 4-like [Conger conger]|uniref:solute carrier family 22 member 4-like n=1 Tax=Conger conger TaxID=82655 RepID=UPI002A599AA1|nr:solute carrier family 22 member 4-like [Conger conger]